MYSGVTNILQRNHIDSMRVETKTSNVVLTLCTRMFRHPIFYFILITFYMCNTIAFCQTRVTFLNINKSAKSQLERRETRNN